MEQKIREVIYQRIVLKKMIFNGIGDHRNGLVHANHRTCKKLRCRLQVQLPDIAVFVHIFPVIPVYKAKPDYIAVNQYGYKK